MTMFQTVSAAIGISLLLAAWPKLSENTPDDSGRTFYVSNQGSDDGDGLSPTAAWRTVSRANRAPLKPGDKVLFQSGGTWRGQLIPQSGSDQAPILYGAYGEGPKPALLGSVSKNRPEDWRDEGNGVWSTLPPAPLEGLSTGLDPDRKPNRWILYNESGAEATCQAAGEEDGQATQFTITCERKGAKESDIQFYMSPFKLELGKTYELSFKAKSSVPLKLDVPVLMSAGPPWESLRRGQAGRPLNVKSEWTSFTEFYEAAATTDRARLTLFLGKSLPEGAVLSLEAFRFGEVDDEGLLLCDVGNVIFDRKASYGVKVWNEADLKAQGQYTYDDEAHVLKLFSSSCPAQFYSEIECALRRHIIDESGVSHCIYENLALKYGGAHGIGGGNTHHITVRDCDLSTIGGGDQGGGDATVRFGNGVEFWGHASDNLVERCRLWEIYDAALTNQNSGARVIQRNIIYRDNVIWNCEYSFEYWNRPENSQTSHIVFENNTCLNAGFGWGHDQRPDPSGRHLCFYDSSAPAQDIFIRSNIFSGARGNAFYAPTWTDEGLDSLKMDRNAWFQEEGDMIALKGRAYPMAEFGRYQEVEGMEPHSVVTDPVPLF